MEYDAECLSPWMTWRIYSFLILKTSNIPSLRFCFLKVSLFPGALQALGCLCCYSTPELGVIEVSAVKFLMAKSDINVA